MRQSDRSRYRKQFTRAIRDAIKECSRATGITDVETVDGYLKKSASILFKRISIILATEQRRILIQKLLKHCTVSVQEAADLAYCEAVQTKFDFFGMEQFQGIAKRITYPERVGMRIEIKYVEYNRSTEEQRLASIEHLGKGIDADIARRDAEIAANKFLQPLVKKYGNLPAEELIQLWSGEQGGMAKEAGCE
jgi:hypothetical protein